MTWTNSYTAWKGMLPAKPRRRPANETGIYLFRHKHEWREFGTHRWPSGRIEPRWECRVCRDVIVQQAVHEPDVSEEA